MNLNVEERNMGRASTDILPLGGEVLVSENGANEEEAEKEWEKLSW